MPALGAPHDAAPGSEQGGLRRSEATVLWNGGISFGGVLAFIFADLIILDIYRRYYGLNTATFLLASFYTAMALSGLAVELAFQAIGLAPTERHAKLVEASITWNDTTFLNIGFLALAALLVVSFVTNGGLPMLKMMNTQPADQTTPTAIAKPRRNPTRQLTTRCQATSQPRLQLAVAVRMPRARRRARPVTRDVLPGLERAGPGLAV